MFKGTTIDELIDTVERAERRAALLGDPEDFAEPGELTDDVDTAMEREAGLRR